MNKFRLLLLVFIISLSAYCQFPTPGIEGFENTTGPDGLPSTNWTLGTGAVGNQWAVFDNAVGTGRWGINNTIPPPPQLPLVYQGLNSGYINRVQTGGAGLTSQNYLATPLVTVPTNGQLRFYTRSFTDGNQGTFYDIKVASGASPANQTSPAAYTTTLATYTEDQLTLNTQGVQNAFNIYTLKVINFPAALIGTQVYIAFIRRNTQVATGIDGDRWLIDNVQLNQRCLDPTTLATAGIFGGSANLTWANPSGATSWEIEVLPAATATTGIGFTYTGTLPYLATTTSYGPLPLTQTPLLPLTAYKYYVRAVCTGGIPSQWVGPFTFTTTAAPPVCGGNFLDPGGSGNYANNITAATGTTTICPVNAGDKVTVAFTTFATEGGLDQLRIYNGNSSAATLLGTYSGTAIPPTFTSTAANGCLTFVFTTDGSVTLSGWVANVTCAPPPTCQQPLTLTATSILTTSAQLGWISPGTATSWQVIALPAGSPAPTAGTTGWTAAPTNPFVLTGLTPGTAYEYYVRGNCGVVDGVSLWSGPRAFSTIPTCPPPTNLTTSSVLSTSVQLNWTSVTPSVSWQVIALPCGSPAPTVGSTGWVAAPTNPFVLTGLTASTCYNFYVRGVCSPTDLSFWTATATATTQALPPVCGGNFVDSGGATGTYQNGENITTTICPVNAGDKVTVAFISFTVENGFDQLRIYDGNSAGATLLGTYTGGNIPPTFTSTAANGCLTFVFTSDGSVTLNGWVANVTCAPPPTCQQPITLTATNVLTTSAQLGWVSPGTATAWQVIALPAGSPAPTAGTTGWTAAPTNPFVLTGLTPGTAYEYYVRGNCGVVDGVSLWSGPIAFSTIPTCPPPTTLTTSSVLSTSVQLNWTSVTPSVSWHVIALPCGSPAPTAATTGWIAAPTNPFVLTGLTASTCYNFYVRGVCSPTDISFWSAQAIATTQALPPVCGGNFVDSGGTAGAYQNNENITTTICPTIPGQLVTVTFTSFNTEANWDGLYVYDGNTVNPATLIPSINGAGNVPGGLAGSYWGNAIPGPFTSSSPSGCLTFVFRSDGSVTNPGWVSNVTCAPPPLCPKPILLTSSSLTFNSLSLGWTNVGPAAAWQVLILPCGSPVPTDTTTGWVPAATNPFAINGLSANTCYTIYVRGDCTTDGVSLWSNPLTITTQIAPPICGGNFLDSGLLGNYTNNSNLSTLVCPTIPTDKVTITFTTFETEPINDILFVYNGNNASAPLIGSYSGTTLPPSITSSAASGCLFFVFISNGSIVRSGWNSNITCGPPAACPRPLGLTASPVVTTSTQLSWIEAGSATSWQILTLPCGSPPPTASSIGFITTSTTTQTINGLSPSCCNEYYIRSVCSATETSAWSQAYQNQNGYYVVWNPIGTGSASVSGTFPGGTVTVTPTGVGNAVTFGSPAGNDINLDVNGNNTFDTFGPTTNPPSRSVTFTFSTPVIIARYNMADIDLGGSWNDSFNFSGVTFTSTTSTNLTTTVTGAVATSDTSGNGEFGSWFTSTAPVTSFSLNFLTTNGLTHAYLAYSLKVFIPCPTTTPTLSVSVNSPTVCITNLATVTATPNLPGTYSYAWTVPIGATAPGNVASFTTATPGVYSVIITDVNSGIVSPSGSGTVTFNPLVPSTFASLPAICAGNTSLTLPLTSIQGSTGTWSPSTIDNTQTLTYTFTPTTGLCASQGTLTVTVNPNITPTFSYPSIITSCAGLSTQVLLPLISNNGVSGTWSPTTLDYSILGTTVYTFTPTQLCASTVTITLIISNTITPTFNPITAFCSGGIAPILPPSSLEGIAGTWSPLLVSTTQTGIYTFTPISGNCAISTTLTVTVIPNIASTFNAISPICFGQLPPPSLPATSLEGTTGTWSPATIDNTQTLTYTFTPTAGICALQGFLTVTVNPFVTPTFNFPATISSCAATTQVILPTTSLNGYSGTWSPLVLDYSIIGTTVYTFTPNSGQCVLSTTITVTITANVTPTFNPIVSFCSGSVAPILPPSSLESIAGTWSPALVSNTQTGVYTFTPNAGICALQTTLTVTVIPITASTFNPIAPLCIGETAPSLPSTSLEGTSGTWSPPTINNTISGTYIFTPSSGQCITNGSLSVTVQSSFDFDITGICIDGDFVLEVGVVNSTFDVSTSNFNWENSDNLTVGFNSSTFNVTQYLNSTVIVEGLPITFSVTVTTADGCTKTESITLDRVYCDIQKGISPNNDGLNDYFDLRLLGVKNLGIFNRYGTKVYNQPNYTNQWFGQTDNGTELPDATYYYVIEFNSGSETKTGWIYINRENK